MFLGTIWIGMLSAYIWLLSQGYRELIRFISHVSFLIVFFSSCPSYTWRLRFVSFEMLAIENFSQLLSRLQYDIRPTAVSRLSGQRVVPLLIPIRPYSAVKDGLRCPRLLRWRLIRASSA